MRPMGVQAALDGVADITNRTSQLSHTLFDIARRLPVDHNSDPTVPHAIRDIAREFADIAQICTELCDISNGKENLGSRGHVDLGRILGRLDLLVGEFELQLINFSTARVRRWFASIFRGETESISGLITKCQSIKGPLRLHLSVLRISSLHESRNEMPDEDEEKKQDLAWMILQEVCCAESWVETSRHVIKILMNTERRPPKRRDAEKLDFRRWTESPGATAGWIYDLVFDKALKTVSAEQRHTARGGTDQTTRTVDENAPVVEKEDEKEFKPLPDDIERELDVSNPRLVVIEELLERWAGQNFQDIRQIAGTGGRDRSRYQEYSRSIAKWHLENEGTSSRRERSSTPRRDRTQHSDRPFNLDNNTNDMPPPRVPTPPPPPATSETTAPMVKPANNDKPASRPHSTLSERKSRTKVSGDASTAFVFGENREPSISLSELDSDNHAESISEAVSNSDPGSTKEKKKRRISSISLSSSTDTIVPAQTKDSGNSKLDTDESPNRITGQEQSSRRAESTKQNVSETGSRRAQSTTKGHSQQNAPRVDFVEDEEASQRQRKRATPSQDTASERRSRDRTSSTRETSSQRSDPLPSRLVTGDGSATRGSKRQSLPNPRQSLSYTERGPAYVSSGPYPTPLQRQGSLPISGMMGAYSNMNQAGLGHMGNYHDRGNTSDDATNFGLSELQKQIDKLKRDAKAQKEADEGARSQMLKVAEEAASHRASLQRKESEVEDLKKAIKEVKEKADRELEEIREREKKSIREIAILQAKLDEQMRLQVENAEKRLAERREDLDRHHEALEKLEQSNNMKLQQCEEEKERYAEYYDDQVARKMQEMEAERKTQDEANQEYYKKLVQAEEDIHSRTEAFEEEKKENEEDTRKYYNELFEAEREKHREELAKTEQKAQMLQKRGEEYWKRYMDAASKSKQKVPAPVKKVPPRPNKAPKGSLDPFRYQVTDESPPKVTPNYLDDDSEDSMTTSELHDDRGSDWTSELTSRSRNRGSSASYLSSQYSRDDALKVILFPPCAGRNDLGYKQLGNYLTISGFKAMFEERGNATHNTAVSRERTTSNSNVLRGTLFWQPPAATAEADLYKSLRNSGWKPTYLRRTDSGQTWFFGAQPVHAQFFSDMYKPQLGESHGKHTHANSEEESLIISKDIVELQELDSLGHFYEETEHEVFLAPNLTSEDIDHIVARSFLAREGRLRKKFRANQMRKVPTRGEIKEVESEVGDDDVSEVDSENTVIAESTESKGSTWSFWAPWSR